MSAKRYAKTSERNIVREFVTYFMTLQPDPTFVDEDPCERREVDGSWKCVAKSGQQCEKGKCKFVTITIKRDGIEKTVTYCMCA